jgi:hypothetical protein
MDAAISGLVGAAIGALAAIGSTIVTSLLQSNQEHSRWLRDQRQAAYSNSMRYILRVLYKRSEITATSGAILGKEDVKELFADMSEALTWTNVACSCCSAQVQATLVQVADTMQSDVSNFVKARIDDAGSKQHHLIWDFEKAFELVSHAARIDIFGTK